MPGRRRSPIISSRPRSDEPDERCLSYAVRAAERSWEVHAYEEAGALVRAGPRGSETR